MWPKSSTDKAETQRASLSKNEWTEMVFDHVLVDPEKVTGMDFFNSARGSIEFQMKENVNVQKLIDSSTKFKGYEIQFSKTLTDETKVVFFNVPMQIPNEEILHLIDSYSGTMKVRKVERELVGGEKGFTTKSGKTIKVQSTTRYVYATFPANKFLRRYYWLEGPCRNDPGRRVTVQHKGQKERACGWCLGYWSILRSARTSLWGACGDLF